jgi:hypothetical protein
MQEIDVGIKPRVLHLSQLYVLPSGGLKVFTVL